MKQAAPSPVVISASSPQATPTATNTAAPSAHPSTAEFANHFKPQVNKLMVPDMSIDSAPGALLDRVSMSRMNIEESAPMTNAQPITTAAPADAVSAKVTPARSSVAAML
jgi:hypothetical protein